MREILFRGKRVDSGEWIQGDLVQFPAHGVVRIVKQEQPYEDAEVDLDTVGQSTGLTDKNGRKIFEGDILKIHYTTELFGETLSTQYNALVMFEDGCNVTKGIFDGAELVNVLSAFSNDEVEAIGNTHDNPELLEVTE